MNMFATFILRALQTALPGLPIFLLPLLSAAFSAASEVVARLSEDDTLTGAEKLEMARHILIRFFDDGFDTVPGLSSMTEAKRDEMIARMVGGAVEIVYFVQYVAALVKSLSKRDQRRLSREMFVKMRQRGDSEGLYLRELVEGGGDEDGEDDAEGAH